MTPPTLTTDRLTLRPLQLSDFPDHAALWADPETVRHISGTPSTEAESWARFLRSAGHWVHMGYGYWVVVETATGLYLGETGLVHFKRDIDLACRDLPEAGWVFARHAQGQGYAREAATAALRWADRTLEASGTWCVIAPKNAASLRLAERVGFGAPTKARFGAEEALILERPRGLSAC